MVELAKNGDQSAFEELYRAYKARVYRLCLRMTHDPTEAEDFTQEAFLQFYRKIQSFRGESALYTFLYRITVNVVLMEKRKKTLDWISLDGVNETEDGEAPFGVGRADPNLALSPERVMFWEAFDELPHGYRIIFLLHDIEGYEHREIATMLDCTVGNCKSQLFKARARLLSMLNPVRMPIDFESSLHRTGF